MAKTSVKHGLPASERRETDFCRHAGRIVSSVLESCRCVRLPEPPLPLNLARPALKASHRRQLRIPATNGARVCPMPSLWECVCDRNMT